MRTPFRVSALNKVLLPTFGNPTIPTFIYAFPHACPVESPAFLRASAAQRYPSLVLSSTWFNLCAPKSCILPRSRRRQNPQQTLIVFHLRFAQVCGVQSAF